MSDPSDLSKFRTPTPELGNNTENVEETSTQNLQNPAKLPSPVPRTSFPVRFVNPNVTNYKRLLLDISSKLFCAKLKGTDNLFKHVYKTIRGVNRVLTSANHCLTTNLLYQTIIRNRNKYVS